MTHLDSGPLYHPALLDRDGNGRGVVHTDDLVLAVHLLLRGAELAGIEIRRQHGRPTAYVALAGEQVEDAVKEFHRGPVLTDLRLFKHELRRVKDHVFDALRGDALRGEERTNASHGPGVVERSRAGELAPRRRR